MLGGLLDWCSPRWHAGKEKALFSEGGYRFTKSNKGLFKKLTVEA